MFIGVYKFFLNRDLLMFIWNSERPPNHDLLKPVSREAGKIFLGNFTYGWVIEGEG